MTAASSKGEHARRSEPPVVIVGLDNLTGLQSARLLARRRVPVHAIAGNMHHFAVRTKVVQSVTHSALSGPPLVEALQRIAVRLGEPATLLPCTDNAVTTISTHRDELEAGYRFVLPDHEQLDTLLDKARFADHARKKGLPIPPTVVVREAADAVRASAELHFPVVVKPAAKTTDWLRATSTKAFRVDDATALRATIEQYLPIGVPLVVQDWVAGGDDALFTVNAYLDRDGSPRMAVVSQKLRQWPAVGGTGCLAVTVCDPEVVDLALRLFSGAEFRGLAYLEVKRDPASGRLVMIEANVGRPTGRAAMAEAAGVELLLTVHRDAHRRPAPLSRASADDAAVKWMYGRHDLQASARLIARRELGVSAWLRSLRGVSVDAVFDVHDPSPFLADIATVSARLARQLVPRTPLRRSAMRRRSAEPSRQGRGGGSKGGPRAFRPSVAHFGLRTAMRVARSPVGDALVHVLERLDRSASPTLPILTYHRVAARRHDDPYDPTLVSATPAEFAAQMVALARARTPITAADLLAVRRGDGRIPSRPVLVTVDDAYEDFAEHAWPILRGLGIPVVLFVPTAFPGDPKRGFWWDRLHRAFHRPPVRPILAACGRSWPVATAAERWQAQRSLRTIVKSLPHAEAMTLVDAVVEDLGGSDAAPGGVLDWATLRYLATQGVSLGPHSRSHAMLDRLTPAEAADEIAGSLDDLRQAVEDPVPILAYPSGQHTSETVRVAAAAGIEVGMTTLRGLNVLPDPDWLVLRRINVGARSSPALIRAQLVPVVSRAADRVHLR